MDERHLEIKVGALLVSAVAGLLGLLWVMGQLTLPKGAAISVDFAHTGNVVKGAPVKLGGVAVGRVERIELDPTRRDAHGEPLVVRMELSLEDRVMAALHEDATVAVATQGPIGEAYLELGVGSEKAPALKRGAVLRGEEAVRLEVVAQKMAGMLEAASRALEENPRVISELMSNVSGLSKTMNGVLTENRDEIKTTASELSVAAKDLRQLAAIARRTMEPGGKGAALLDNAAASAQQVRKDLPQLSSDAGKALGGLAALSGSFTPEDGKRLKEAIARYSAAGEHLDQIAARADRILARIEAGEGTIGGLQKDPQLYKDLKDLISDLKQHPWKVIWKE